MVGLKNWLTTLMMVSRQISYMKPDCVLAHYVLDFFKIIWYTLENNCILEGV